MRSTADRPTCPMAIRGNDGRHGEDRVDLNGDWRRIWSEIIRGSREVCNRGRMTLAGAVVAREAQAGSFCPIGPVGTRRMGVRHFVAWGTTESGEPWSRWTESLAEHWESVDVERE